MLSMNTTNKKIYFKSTLKNFKELKKLLPNKNIYINNFEEFDKINVGKKQYMLEFQKV